MYVLRERNALHDEFASHLGDILGNLVVFLLPITYLWVLWWLRPFGNSPDYAWVPIGILIGTLLLLNILRLRASPIAMFILVWGLFLTIASASFVYQSHHLLLFLIVPLVFAQGLLSTRVVASLLVVTLLDLCVMFYYLRVPLTTALFFMVFMGVLVVVIGLSMRYLHNVMQVVWNRHAELDQIVLLARERRGELRRMVKQLDETNERFYQMNHQLKAAVAEAREARQVKQQFAQNITHELRTPLNLIVGFVEMMTQSESHYAAPLPNAYLRDLDIIYNNARHLQALIDDILDMSRIEAAQMTVNPVPTDLAHLLTQSIETVRGLVESKGLYLKLEYDDTLPQLDIDQTRIRQVLFNLINNAARFTDVGGITVRCETAAEYVLCCVADTGMGIEEEALMRVFGAFQQVDTHQRGGTGLGLAISKHFVEMHGGKMWAQSVKGQGSQFYFTLPLMPEVSKQAPTLSEVQNWHIGHSRFGDRLVYLVTQSQSSVNLLSRYLTDCKVKAVPNASQLEALARTQTPNALLIDRNTIEWQPGSTMIPAQWREIPIIECALVGEEKRRRDLSVDGYLMKPVTPEDLRELMRQFGAAVDTVLVIDDNRDFVQYVARILDHPLRQYQVIRAYSGQEGLQLMAFKLPDLILLDLEMDGIDGFEVIEAIRSKPETRHIPIVIISGYENRATPEVLEGPFVVTRQSGIHPHEMIQWVQAILNS